MKRLSDITQSASERVNGMEDNEAIEECLRVTPGAYRYFIDCVRVAIHTHYISEELKGQATLAKGVK